MSDDGYLLDTSAIFSLMEDEAGAERVEQILLHEKTWLPWPVLMELYYITQREHGTAEAERRYALLKHSPVEILWEMDEPTLLTAARYKASERLSMADAIISAYAPRLGAVLVHKDPELEALAGHVQLELLPYK